MKKYVLFIDICSSTRIMENLKSNENEDKYAGLVQTVYDFLIAFGEDIGAKIYKFMGDGFIILLNDNANVDFVFDYVISAFSSLNTIIDTFFDSFIDYSIEKKGITGGLAYGSVFEIRLGNSQEYFGRPLNLAARLQASNEAANTILIQKEIYARIGKYGPKAACKETSRTFKNIDNGNKMRCYQFFPEAMNGIHIDDLVSELDYIKMNKEEKTIYEKKNIKIIRMQMLKINEKISIVNQ